MSPKLKIYIYIFGQTGMFLFKLVIRFRECAAHYDSTFGHTSHRLLFNCHGFHL